MVHTQRFLQRRFPPFPAMHNMHCATCCKMRLWFIRCVLIYAQKSALTHRCSDLLNIRNMPAVWAGFFMRIIFICSIWPGSAPARSSNVQRSEVGGGWVQPLPLFAGLRPDRPPPSGVCVSARRAGDAFNHRKNKKGRVLNE